MQLCLRFKNIFKLNIKIGTQVQQHLVPSKSITLLLINIIYIYICISQIIFYINHLLVSEHNNIISEHNNIVYIVNICGVITYK